MSETLPGEYLGWAIERVADLFVQSAEAQLHPAYLHVGDSHKSIIEAVTYDISALVDAIHRNDTAEIVDGKCVPENILSEENWIEHYRQIHAIKDVLGAYVQVTKEACRREPKNDGAKLLSLFHGYAQRIFQSVIEDGIGMKEMARSLASDATNKRDVIDVIRPTLEYALSLDPDFNSAGPTQ